MQFATQLRRARLTFAVLMASTTCIIMSAVTTHLLTPEIFWQRWPHVLLIDLLVANPTAILLSPLIRRLCHRLYPDLRNN
jgi:Protein of unknown function (DUF2798)